MTAKHDENTVPLTLGLYELHWLCAYLKDARNDAEDDHQEVERLHTDVAIRAAKVALNQELDSMTKVIEALDVAITTDDAREAIAKKLAAMTPPVA
jgi:hypothetical protein